MSDFELFPYRIFLDSSILQTLQDYGGFLYENEPLEARDNIHRDLNGVTKLEALRSIMRISERAPFEFAISNHSFDEVAAKNDKRYLQWAYDVLDHWLSCEAELSNTPEKNEKIAKIDALSYGYLSLGDKNLIKDAIDYDCDCFLTMENRLPKNANHIEKTLGIRVLSPIELWKLIEPWENLFV
jgi:hypothetical protein